MSTAKAICYANNINAVEIKSTELLARNILSDSDLKVSIIDAKNDQIYAGIYDNNFNELLEFAGSIDSFLDKLENIIMQEKEIQNISLVGNGTKKYKDAILKKCSNILKVNKILFEEDEMQEAKYMFEIVEEKVKKGDILNAKNILPHYLKASSAERAKKYDTI